VHDVSFDFYGKRLATCSSDQRIKVWELTSPFCLQESWKAHDGAILSVDWAHPEFGQIIASCSLDRTVRIWEEGGKRWTERARLADGKGPVYHVAFCPHNFGLKVATIGADGVVRIYECLDTVQLNQWTLMVLSLIWTW